MSGEHFGKKIASYLTKNTVIYIYILFNVVINGFIKN